MMIRFAICDDEPLLREYIASLVTTWSTDTQYTVRLSAFESAEGLLDSLEDDHVFDILLLDIQMGKMDGIQLARHIRQLNEHVVIIFITGVADYIMDGYDVSALHYLLKPINETKLFETLDKAVKKIATPDRSMLFDVSGTSVRVPVRDVYFVESFAQYSDVSLKDELLRIRTPLFKIEEELGDVFVRCHRSYLVNLEHIDRITKTDAVLDNGKHVPISRRMHADVMSAWTAYVRNDVYA